MKVFYSFLLLAVFLFSANTHAQRILLNQNFENITGLTGDSLPTGWHQVNVTAPPSCAWSNWAPRDSNQVHCLTNTLPGFTTKAYLSKRALTIPWTCTNASISDVWVYTDSLRIAAGDSLIFDMQLGTWPDGQSTYYRDSVQIWVTTTQVPGSQITRLGTIASLPQASNNWQHKIFDLSTYAGQKVYVAFRYYMNLAVDGIMVNIDNVIVRNLSGPPVGVNTNNGNVPKAFALEQNYPNPFNPSTTISYDLPKSEFVNITVFNAIGQKVAVLVNETKQAGTYEVNFDASALPSGVYMYRIDAGSFSKTMKMALIK
jgi:hypothetical protein